MAIDTRNPWLRGEAVVPVPPLEAVDHLRDPDALRLLFPEIGIDVDPHDTVKVGTNLTLARVALERNVGLEVVELDVDMEKIRDAIARIVLLINASRFAPNTRIESILRPHVDDKDKSVVGFDVYAPPEGGLAYSMPFGSRIVSGAVNQAVRKLPDRFDALRQDRAA